MQFFKRMLLLLILVAGLGAGWGVWFAYRPLATPGGQPLDFSIPFGSSLRGVSQQMADAGLDFAPWQFTLLGQSTAIKAGSYEVASGITPLGLLEKLTRGDVSQGELLLVEGMNFRQLRAAIDAHPDLKHDTARLSERDLLAQIGAHEAHPEGLFFPDTYLFDKQSSDLDVFRRAYRTMQKQLAQAWSQRAAQLPLKSAYEALILASIVEKETGRAADRSLVAAVFNNRLHSGMLLQTDPAIIYGMGARYAGKIHKRDLQTDTPYNTYLRPGLPPTPIAMPGQAALSAALHPAQSDKLYFVARGDGSSEFSRSLDEHNRAVAKYLKGK